MHRIAGLLLAALLSSSAGCAAASGSPYADASAAVRDSAEAERLTREAAAMMESDPDGAETLLRAALVADLYHGPAHNNLGVVRLRQGRLYEAAGEFEWARKLMPGHPDPRMNLALTLERAGRIDDALATYETALEVYPGHLPTVQALTRCQLRHGRDDAHLRERLEQISLQGDPEPWRSWARHRLVEMLP